MAAEGRALDVPALEGWLWDAACQIRGPLDAPKFKDYILPLVFLKRLSDVFDDEVDRVAQDFPSRRIAEQLVARDHRLVRFYVPETARWATTARKPAGFVLDFVGIFDRLERALAFDSEDVKEVIDDLDVLRRRFEALMGEARAAYLPLAKGPADDKQTERILEHFRDRPRREEFYELYRELEQLHEILSPDPFLRPFIEDYEILTRIYLIVRSNYDPGADLDRDFMRKTAALVQRLAEAGTIEAPTLVYEGDAEALERIAAGHEPETVKVFNLIKAFHRMAAEKGAQEPHLISIGERAEEIARQFEDRQLTTQQALQLLLGLSTERKVAEEQQQYLALSPAPFAIYRELEREGIASAESIARQMSDAFGRYPHWRTSPEQESEVRKALYTALFSDAKLQAEDVGRAVALAERLWTMLRVAEG